MYGGLRYSQVDGIMIETKKERLLLQEKEDFMKKFRRLAALLLCALVLGTACSKDGGNENDAPVILTNVFRGTEASLPGNRSIRTGVEPYYDPASGEMLFCCDGGENSFVLTLDADGTVVREQPLDGYRQPRNGVLTKECLYSVSTLYDDAFQEQTYHVVTYLLADGTYTVSDDVRGMFTQNGDDFLLKRIAVDGDGDFILASEREIVVTDSAFRKQFSAVVPEEISTLTASANGDVYVTVKSLSGKPVLRKIDRETGEPGALIQPPENIRVKKFLFGEGYDVFLSAEDGVYGWNFTEKEAVLLLDYAGSDLYANNVSTAKVVNADRMILFERDPETQEVLPVIRLRSADIDLSQEKILEIAYVYGEYDLSAAIMEFNQKNPGVRVKAMDYSQYNTVENPDGGRGKLINDILLGLYKPDLVTSYSPEDSLLSQIYANGLYADLYPLMEADGTVMRDDLLGCIPRTFETDEGKLWAIGHSVSVQTYMGTKAMLGDRTGWTLSEMLDFAKSLSEGTDLMYGISQQILLKSLLGWDGFRLFVDMETNTCDFEREDFLHFLEFLRSLPETREEVVRDYEGLGEYDAELYLDGKVALGMTACGSIASWCSAKASFGMSDVVYIGYPTADGKTDGGMVEITPYVITSFCEYPDEAWDFIEFLLAPEEEDRDPMSDGFPVLKEKFVNLCEANYDSRFMYNNGRLSYVTPEAEALFPHPGVQIPFTEEDAQALFRWFDEDIGYPAAESVDREIEAIVNEEVSRYLAGANSAADCARIIQSRVSLWLAEHE